MLGRGGGLQFQGQSWALGALTGSGEGGCASRPHPQQSITAARAPGCHPAGPVQWPPCSLPQTDGPTHTVTSAAPSTGRPPLASVCVCVCLCARVHAHCPQPGPCSSQTPGLGSAQWTGRRLTSLVTRPPHLVTTGEAQQGTGAPRGGRGQGKVRWGDAFRLPPAARVALLEGTERPGSGEGRPSRAGGWQPAAGWESRQSSGSALTPPPHTPPPHKQGRGAKSTAGSSGAGEGGAAAAQLPWGWVGHSWEPSPPPAHPLPQAPGLGPGQSSQRPPLAQLKDPQGSLLPIQLIPGPEALERFWSRTRLCASLAQFRCLPHGPLLGHSRGQLYGTLLGLQWRFPGWGRPPTAGSGGPPEAPGQPTPSPSQASGEGTTEEPPSTQPPATSTAQASLAQGKNRIDATGFTHSFSQYFPASAGKWAHPEPQPRLAEGPPGAQGPPSLEKSIYYLGSPHPPPLPLHRLPSSCLQAPRSALLQDTLLGGPSLMLSTAISMSSGGMGSRGAISDPGPSPLHPLTKVWAPCSL